MVDSIQDILSGSLSCILHRMHEGCTCPVAVGSARPLGYTEFNPPEVILSVDLSRKRSILAREAGGVLGPEDLEIAPLTIADRCDFGNPTEDPRDDDSVSARRSDIAAAALWTNWRALAS